MLTGNPPSPLPEVFALWEESAALWEGRSLCGRGGACVRGGVCLLGEGPVLGEGSVWEGGALWEGRGLCGWGGFCASAGWPWVSSKCHPRLPGLCCAALGGRRQVRCPRTVRQLHPLQNSASSRQATGCALLLGGVVSVWEGGNPGEALGVWAPLCR